MMKSTFRTGLLLACLALLAWPAGSEPLETLFGASAGLRLAGSGARATLRLVPAGRRNRMGNPVLRLEMLVDGRVVDSVEATSGRGWTQDRDRHRAGSGAPLPDGIYAVTPVVDRGGLGYEFGGSFVAVTPLFESGRALIGIHRDPSFETDNGQDGTSGCVGITSRDGQKRFNGFVERYRPTRMEVEIAP